MFPVYTYVELQYWYWHMCLYCLYNTVMYKCIFFGEYILANWVYHLILISTSRVNNINYISFFCSLCENNISNEGASTLAGALQVNQNLQTLEWVLTPYPNWQELYAENLVAVMGIPFPDVDATKFCHWLLVSHSQNEDKHFVFRHWLCNYVLQITECRIPDLYLVLWNLPSVWSKDTDVASGLRLWGMPGML